jgi:hypothetical protein
MKKLFSYCLSLLLALTLASCTHPLDATHQTTDYFPGGSQFYSFGTSQSQENFANVDRAQLHFGLYAKERGWEPLVVGHGSGRFNALQAYAPIDMRWRLKDGREFILENIDARALNQEYFKTHQILLQHQREHRPYHGAGDYDPALVVEVKDDTFILKWLLIINKTPVNERFQANGAANRWVREYEEHTIATLKGNPTSNINFDNWFETKK